jgi:catechol 2,3-dioxygenase-like lactoylglutathione lyase family enzyme
MTTTIPSGTGLQSAPVAGDARLTHGTLEGRSLPPARLLYEKLLGLRCVQHSPQSQLVGGCGSVAIVAVEAGNTAHGQGNENRWVILAGSRAAVLTIHARAAGSRAEFAISELTEPQEAAGECAFQLQDADGNWWEVNSRSGSYYQELFERGDYDREGGRSL